MTADEALAAIRRLLDREAPCRRDNGYSRPWIAERIDEVLMRYETTPKEVPHEGSQPAPPARARRSGEIKG